VHVPADGQPALAVGDRVTAEIDWDRRYRHMRMHSALHLLCAVVEGGVTGGSIGTDKSRLDFDLPDTQLDKDKIAAELNRLVSEDHPMGARWITDAELQASPDLVRTMSVKPPQGTGRVRLMEIPGVDLQPCGGTHVRRTGEIGRLRVGKIENKGRHNRRINIHLEE
jgi:misacylated tRNA(Ala) deacylase